MSKPVALFDIDNTIYDGFSLLQLLDEQVDQGIGEKDTLTKTTALLNSYRNGMLEYEQAIREVLEAYALSLKGKLFDNVLCSTKQFFQTSSDFYEFTRPLIKEISITHDVIIVTGEPQTFGQAVVELLGCSDYCSTTYQVEQGIFTGEVTSYLATRHEKHEAIRHLLVGHHTRGSLGFGDSEGDIEMLKAVDHAICINSTPGLKKIAEQNGWHIVTPVSIRHVVKSLLNN